MIGVKRDGQIGLVKSYILAVGGKHVEIPAQRHISLGGRNMLSFRNRLPGTVGNAVFTLKTNLSQNGADRLIAGGVMEPKEEYGKRYQQKNARCTDR